MIIEISNSSTSLQEFVTVELQGTITSLSEDVYANVALGNMVVKQNDRVHLQVGNHRVIGTIESLHKPLVVLKKVTAMNSSMEDPSFDDKKKEYCVEAVIRRRIIFTERPQPIVNETSVEE
jgi:chromosome transmission fidelity protein 8